MTHDEDFLEGLMDSSGITDSAQALAQYVNWLAREGYGEPERIDLESGGYETGLEIGHLLREKTN